jgi:septum formation protein
VLLLASASQRRTELLDLIKIEHKVVAQNFDEDSVTNSDPFMHSQEIVKGKNESAYNLLSEEDKKLPILTSDTLVFTPSGEILGKPMNDDDNIAMLEKFSNTTHSVFSSVMVRLQDQIKIKTCETLVTFKKLSDDEIKSYVYSNEGKGKAGGYGIHGPAGKFISRIEGSYTNVVGLPVHETYEILSDLKII